MLLKKKTCGQAPYSPAGELPAGEPAVTADGLTIHPRVDRALSRESVTLTVTSVSRTLSRSQEFRTLGYAVCCVRTPSVVLTVVLVCR